MMSDEKLFAEIARIWVANGGDAEGIDWSISKLKQAIQDEIDSRVHDDEVNSDGYQS